MTWPLRPVSELCIFATDCVNKTAPTVDYETRFKMIRTTNIKGGFIDLDTVRYVTEDTFREWTRRSRPAAGDVILTREAPVGEVGRVTFRDDDVMLGQRLFHYRPDPDLLDSNYLAYVLQSPEVQGALHGKSFGATVPHVKVGDAESLPIPCPALPVQRRIGDTLAAYDDLIENNQRRLKLLEEAARRMYREWFVALRFPGYERVKVIDGTPEGWSKVPLYDFAELTMGHPFQSSHFNNERFGLPIVRIRDIPTLLPKTWTTEPPPTTEYVVERGDFLIGMDGFFHMNHWAGRSALLVQRVCRVRPFEDQYRGYLAQALFDPIKHFEATISGATVAHLGARHLRSITVLVPPETCLNALTQLNSMLEQKIILTEAAQTAQAARNALVPRLISGALAV